MAAKILKTNVIYFQTRKIFSSSLSGIGNVQTRQWTQGCLTSDVDFQIQPWHAARDLPRSASAGLSQPFEQL